MPRQNYAYYFTSTSPAAAPYAFLAKERDTETGLSYFGARYYSSDLSIWLSVDPMSGKYPSLSPYVYCADNPMRCVDPNGREIVGTDGKPVSYSIDENGNTIWSSNASDDTKRIGNAMLQTKTGKEQLDKLIASKTKITLKISPLKVVNGNDLTMGQTSFEKCFMNPSGDIDVQEATITIFEGTINAFLKDKDFKYNVENLNATLYLFVRIANPTVDQYIGAVGCHEVEHTTPESVKLNFQNSSDLETMPEVKREDFLWDLILMRKK